MEADRKDRLPEGVRSSGLWGRSANSVMMIAMFCSLALWTWRAWADPLTDFGREIYVPWQLSLGSNLYQDIAYFNGVLSPMFNAGVFEVLGASLMTLFWANLAILALISVLLYRLLRSEGDRWTSGLSMAMFLSLFAFPQYIFQANYNYVAPYSHEMTHGLLISLVSLILLSRYLRRGRLVHSVLCGVAVGFAFFTKPEFFLAILPSTFLPILLSKRRDTTGGLAIPKDGWAYLTGLTSTVVLGWLLIRQSMPQGFADQGFLGGWGHIFNRDLTNLKFYRDILGTAELADNLVMTLKWSVLGLGVVGLAVLASLAFGRSRFARPSWWGFVLIFLVFAAIVTIQSETLGWLAAFQPLPLVLIILLWRTIDAGRQRGLSEAEVAGYLLRLSVVSFSLLLLLKMLLRVRIAHYGFVLAMPGTLVLGVFLIQGLPDWIQGKGGSRAVMRAACSGLMVGLIAVHLHATSSWLELKKVELGEGGDMIHVDQRGDVINDLIADLNRVKAPRDTLAVLPEGVMLNYLTRMENPTGHINFMPPEMVMFGEEAMVMAFSAAPPDWVVITDRTMPEYGLEGFGFDYGLDLLAWIEANYQLHSRVVAKNPGPFGLRYAMILSRRTHVLGETAGTDLAR